MNTVDVFTAEPPVQSSAIRSEPFGRLVITFDSKNRRAVASLLWSRCGRRRTGNYSRADECVNFGRKSCEFSERLQASEEEEEEKDGGRLQTTNWTSDRPRSVCPDWLSSCGFVELFLRNVNPLSNTGSGSACQPAAATSRAARTLDDLSGSAS